MTIIDGTLTPILSDDEQRRLQGEAFIEASSAPVVTDDSPRVWYHGGRGLNGNSANGHRDAQAAKHGEACLEAAQ